MSPVNAASRSAWPAREPSDAADTTSGTTPSCGTRTTTGSSGACSRITWAFVPLTPKEETPARRGRPVSGHRRSSVSSSTAPADQSTWEVGASTCSVAGEDAVPQCLDHLDHAGDARGGLRVPDVRLQRTQPERLFAVLAVGGEQRLRLDRVAEGGTGAVALHRVDVGRRSARRRVRAADHALLGRSVGGGEAVGGAVLVDRAEPGPPRARDAPVAAGLGEPFQDDDARRPRPSRCRRPRRRYDLKRPSAASALPGELHEGARGGPSTVAPPARAREHSPRRSAWAARWRATREEEQAVSTVTAGPSRPKT